MRGVIYVCVLGWERRVTNEYLLFLIFNFDKSDDFR